MCSVVTGSYLTFRGFSILFGGYPAETKVIGHMMDPYANHPEMGLVKILIWLGIFVGLNFFFMLIQTHGNMCKRPMSDDDYASIRQLTAESVAAMKKAEEDANTPEDPEAQKDRQTKEQRESER